jgi:hypothetical protein
VTDRLGGFFWLTQRVIAEIVGQYWAHPAWAGRMFWLKRNRLTGS